MTKATPVYPPMRCVRLAYTLGEDDFYDPQYREEICGWISWGRTSVLAATRKRDSVPIILSSQHPGSR